MKFAVGQQWKDRSGIIETIVDIDDPKYLEAPIRTKSGYYYTTEGSVLILFGTQGVMVDESGGYDLVTLLTPEHEVSSPHRATPTSLVLSPQELSLVEKALTSFIADGFSGSKEENEALEGLVAKGLVSTPAPKPMTSFPTKDDPGFIVLGGVYECRDGEEVEVLRHSIHPGYGPYLWVTSRGTCTGNGDYINGADSEYDLMRRIR